MANLKPENVKRFVEDISKEVAKNAYEGGGGTVVVNELPETGEEHTIYELHTTTPSIISYWIYVNGEWVNIDENWEFETQDKTVSPSTIKQEVTPDEGYDGLSKVTVNAVTNTIDSNIKAGNIKKDVAILGVTGTYDGEAIELQDKTVSPSTNTQKIVADENYDGLGKVTINAVTSAIDSNIKAENIKKDVSILGVTGTYEGGGSGGGDIVMYGPEECSYKVNWQSVVDFMQNTLKIDVNTKATYGQGLSVPLFMCSYPREGELWKTDATVNLVIYVQEDDARIGLGEDSYSQPSNGLRGLYLEGDLPTIGLDTTIKEAILALPTTINRSSDGYNYMLMPYFDMIKIEE